MAYITFRRRSTSSSPCPGPVGRSTSPVTPPPTCRSITAGPTPLAASLPAPPPPTPINPLLFNGINNSYWGGFNQTANPGIAMQIDQAKVTQLGTLVVTTPQFSTPEYGFNTNTVLAGEAVSLTSIVTDSAGTPTLQWQMEDLSNPGTFTNLPGGNLTNVNVDTSGFGGSVKGIRLVATDGGTSVTSAVVTLTVDAASAPVVAQDPTPSNYKPLSWTRWNVQCGLHGEPAHFLPMAEKPGRVDVDQHSQLDKPHRDKQYVYHRKRSMTVTPAFIGLSRSNSVGTSASSRRPGYVQYSGHSPIPLVRAHPVWRP